MKCLEIYDARKAKLEEIEDGIAYIGSGSNPNTRGLRSITPISLKSS